MPKLTAKNNSLSSQTKTVTSRTTRVIIVQEISDTSSSATASNELSPTRSSSPTVVAAAAGRQHTLNGELEFSFARRSDDLEITGDHLPSPADDAAPSSPSSCIGNVDRILSTLALRGDIEPYDDVQHCISATSGTPCFSSPKLSIPSGTAAANSNDEQQTKTTRTTTTRTSCIEYVEMTSSCDAETKSNVNMLEVVPVSVGGYVYHREGSLVTLAGRDETFHKQRSGNVQTTVADGTISEVSTGSKLKSENSSLEADEKMVNVANIYEMQTVSETVEKQMVQDQLVAAKSMIIKDSDGGSLPGGPWPTDHAPKSSNMISSVAKATHRQHLVKKFRSFAKPTAVGPLPSEFGKNIAVLANSGGSRTPKILQHGVEDLASIEDSKTYRMLRPVLATMTVVGLYFTRQGAALHRGGGARPCIVDFVTRRINSRQQIYCMFVILVLLANFIWSLTAFSGTNSFGALLFFKIMVSISFYEAASRAVIAYYACRDRKCGLRELFTAVDAVFFSDGIIPYEDEWSKFVKLTLVVTFVVTIANVAVTSYGMFAPGNAISYFDIYVHGNNASSTSIFLFKIYWMLVTAVNSIVASLSIAFFVAVCYVFYKEFEYIRRTFARKVAEMNDLAAVRGALIGGSGEMNDLAAVRGALIGGSGEMNDLAAVRGALIGGSGEIE